MNLYIPEKIKAYIKERDYSIDGIGMSDSTVMVFEDLVLKIEKQCEESEHEHRIMKWLDGKLPVPKVICSESEKGFHYLLMSKVPGKMSCDEYYMNRPDELAGLLAEGLKMLWAVDASECPVMNHLDRKLELAGYRVRNGLAGTENAEPETYGPDGFQNPSALLAWLEKNRPEEELVFSHGDYCLPNLFLADGKVSGFIDLGRSGTADKYQDIALCWRSLTHNFAGAYGGRAYSGLKPELLFEKLGLKPDYEKIRYYVLLDELF